MAGVDVLGCIAAIVSTFHGAADLALALRQRSDRRRRRNGVFNPKMAVQETMLVNSLSDGEAQCKAARNTSYARYGAAFKIGDAVALAALKDVIVGLQMDVVSALQVARAIEAATLDLERLHEASIMNKSNALRAVDDLCKRLPEPEGGHALESQPLRTVESAGAQERQSPEFDRIVRKSLPDSGYGGSQASPRHRHTASITSTLFSEESCVTADSYEHPGGTARRDFDTLRVAAVTSNERIQTDLSHSHSVTQWEDDDGVVRATLAPEVVTPEYQSMLPQRSSRAARPMPLESYSLGNVHPAFRNTHMVHSPALQPPEPDNAWAPLARPAKINDYHNFCKGAWQVRDRIEEGLSIAMLPDAAGFTVPHWKCKQCQFRSKTMNNATDLPDYVYFTSSGIRCRWVFLAKSHIHAEEAQNTPEAYAYGCIFCAAEGRETAVHRLDALMSHILSKHKTAMMTPEVKAKTMCIVGGSPEKNSDWDINLPESHKRKLSGFVGEYIIKAITGLS
ncbi:hypothetical protein DOTSEDRAFT_177211 [Dothistroma septosporum NZE10]|uniref:Uncharacterized protein n=1 Tax=Dothistroma septosporum (strain NZE10 / CBS 128990) TaxID=675120 RepID=N1PKL4_DOTSN|nr:hypothetical protein DOTSEDRAFT_177211 [Dothistroma septosporum NZE10]